ncbi:MAG: ComEC/Rec2 family competence protein [bacterium]|nr:ComEC/Rec2 family competence protein [bacterium]
MTSWYFNFLALGLVLGILLGTFVEWGWGLILLPVVVGVGLLFLDKQKYILISLICFGLTLGLTRIYLVPQASDELVNKVGEKVEFTGILVAEPDRRDTQIRLTVRPNGFKDKVLVVAPTYGSYKYGDELKITGKLEWPESFETEAGKIFDYQKYLAKDGIFFIVNFSEIERIGGDEGNTVIASLFSLKSWFVGRLEKLLPEPESSLLAGLVVGEKQALGKEWNDRFRTVGLSHIVVLSGYNLSIVAKYILIIAGLFLSKNLSLLAGAGGIVAFAIMVGGGATVLRASVMALIALLARATGRLYQATIALIMAGVLMLLWNPQVLVYDLGFQLSFLATLGVIHGPVLLAPYFSKLTDRWGVKDILLTTLSAQIIVLPWILYTTGNLSLVALPANLLVLPVIPATMLFGFLTTFISPLAFIAHLLLAYILLVVKILAIFPLAATTIKTFPLILVFICYLLIFYWAYRLNKKPAVLMLSELPETHDQTANQN